MKILVHLRIYSLLYCIKHTDETLLLIISNEVKPVEFRRMKIFKKKLFHSFLNKRRRLDIIKKPIERYSV